MELNDGSKLSGNLNDLYRDPVLQAFDNYKTGTDEYVLSKASSERIETDI
jgi:hypothetical protein